MNTVRDDLVVITDAMRLLYERTDSGCLQAEYRLTEDERRAFLERVYASNPHLVGARVADVADMMTNSDAFLNLTETDRYVEYWMALPWSRQSMVHHLAVIAAVVVGIPDFWRVPDDRYDEWLAKVTEWQQRQPA